MLPGLLVVPWLPAVPRLRARRALASGAIVRVREPAAAFVFFGLQLCGQTRVFVDVLAAAAAVAGRVRVIGAEMAFIGWVGRATCASVAGWWAGWGGVLAGTVDGFGGFVPLGLFGVDIYVEPGL